MTRSPTVALAVGMNWTYKRHLGIVAGVQDFADEQGWNIIVDEFPANNLSAKRSNPVSYDGIIARAKDKLPNRSQRLGIPLVNVWLSSPVQAKLPGVFPDFAAAGRIRAEHLMSRGLRQFAAMGTREDAACKIELQAFRETVEDAGFDYHEVEVPISHSSSYALESKAEKLIDGWMGQWKPPIGVFVYDDVDGRLIAQNCRRRGWRVPEDVAIVSGANEEIVCARPRPSLTSLDRGYERVGYLAAKLLAELMSNQVDDNKVISDTPPKHILVPPVGLVVRESTDFFSASDDLVAAAISFISSNCHKQIGQEDVARSVVSETRTLQRRFRKTLNRSIAEMICHVRIERAKRELVHSKRSMKAIARDVGFGSPMRMYNTFRRVLGVNPTEFRNRHTGRDIDQ